MVLSHLIQIIETRVNIEVFHTELSDTTDKNPSPEVGLNVTSGYISVWRLIRNFYKTVVMRKYFAKF